MQNFLEFNLAKYQIFFSETEVYSALLMQMAGILQKSPEILEKHNEDSLTLVTNLLRLLFKNNEKNMEIFKELNLFVFAIDNENFDEKHVSNILFYAIIEENNPKNISFYFELLFNKLEYIN